MQETRKKILIVDDEETVLLMMERQVSADGFDVVTATRGSEGLAMAEQEQPDMILLDIMMPDMNGYAVCRKLRENPATANTPIIMVTGLHSQTDAIEGKLAGANAVLVKPVAREELLKTIHKHLGSPFRV